MPALGIYDTEITGPLIKALRAGNFQTTACKIAGISMRQYRRWMADGKAGKSPYHVEFRRQVKMAMALAEADALENVRKAGAVQWQASAWQLERCYPQRYGRKDKSEIVVDTGGKTKNVAQVVDEIKAVLAQQAAAPAIDDPDERDLPPELPTPGGGEYGG